MKLRLFCTFLLVACFSSTLLAQQVRDAPGDEAASLPPRERFHLFLLIGQSNMAGRGKVAEQDRKPHPRVLTLNKDGCWKPATDPLHFDKPHVVGVGLGRSFGIRIADSDRQVTVGLIPCAVGGSPISSWEPGGHHRQTKSHPYDAAIRRTKLALKSGTLKGILWHQGESDSNPGQAEVYEQRLHALVGRLRKELNTPKVPFIAGQLGQFAERPWNDAKKLIDAAHQNLPGKTPHTAFVKSTNLQHNGDQVHFDAASYRKLGRRFAKAYLQLGGKQTVSRILFGSCVKQDKPMPIFEKIVAARPELFIFLGDNIYADTTDMDVMRAKYAKLAADAGFAKLMKACPVLATWDDHDYGANDAGAEYPLRVESQQIFVDFWRDPPDSPRRKRPGVYDAHVFGPEGRRVQVILLDTRYFRGPLKKGERRIGGPYLPTDDKSVTMLGADQWEWLERQLRIPAELRIIASSIQCLSAAAGQETWSNLPHERERLFQLIDDTHAGGVLLISGDRHWAELSMVADDVPYPLYDLTSSSFNQLHTRGTPTDNKYRTGSPTYHRENFGSITVNWERSDPEVVLQVLDLQSKVQIEKVLRLSELQP